MKILKNETYKNLIEDSKCLHKFWKDEEQKEKDKINSELNDLPEAPIKFCCSCCEGRGYNEKKFKVFKKSDVGYKGMKIISKEAICVDCLKEIRRDYYEDNN